MGLKFEIADDTVTPPLTGFIYKNEICIKWICFIIFKICTDTYNAGQVTKQIFRTVCIEAVALDNAAVVVYCNICGSI